MLSLSLSLSLSLFLPHTQHTHTHTHTGMGFCMNDKKLMNMAHVSSSLQWGGFLQQYSPIWLHCASSRAQNSNDMSNDFVWFVFLHVGIKNSNDMINDFALMRAKNQSLVCMHTHRESQVYLMKARLFSPNDFDSFILNPSTYKCASRGRFFGTLKIIVLPPH